MSKLNKIAVIGATGLAGHHVVKEALTQGLDVVAVVRSPEKIDPADHLKVCKGDALDVTSLIDAFKDVDAVISCIGPANNFKPKRIMSEGTQNIIKACTANNINRFVMMSGILQSSGKNLHLADRMMLRIIRIFLKKVYNDKIVAEKSVQNSSLDWVIVRAAGLEALETHENYIAAPKAPVSAFKKLNVVDCARCLVRAVQEDDWTKQIIHVGK